MTLIEAAKLALEHGEFPQGSGIIHELRQAIAKAEQQEPVAGVVLRKGSPTLLQDKHIEPSDQRLYTAPPKREWQGLTEEQKLALCKQFPDHLTFNAIDAIEAKCRDKNT